MTRKAYPCDVTDREWQIIEPLLPEAQGIGRPRQVDLREIVNGIFYVLREGCSWRALPHDLPPWQTVYNYFRHWQRLGVWQEIHTKIRNQVRKRLEKIDNPTAGIIDSQSVKTVEKRGKCTVTMVENSLIATQALYLSGYFRTLVSCYGDGSQLSRALGRSSSRWKPPRQRII